VPHFIYTDHTHLANLVYPHFDRRTLLRGAWLDLEARAYHSAVRVFTRSTNIDRSLIEDYACDEGHVVCVGAGANVMPGFEGVGPAVEQQPPRILFVGVDWARKGGPELVQAFEQVAADVAGLELEIVGCDPGMAMPAGVTVVGRVAREQLHAHYERASIFCLPTKREPYGVALVEAMHFGLPIVATRVGAVPEIVAEGETGVLVDAGSVPELVEALGKLARDPQLRVEMSRCARERARRAFTWSAVGERMIAEITRTIASPSGASNESKPRSPSGEPNESKPRSPSGEPNQSKPQEQVER
jgi:glycosyltransferase involved in cell wall biosynthesis